MNIPRKNFIKLTTAASGALAVNSVLGNSLFTGCSGDEKRKIKKFGIQLWTLRTEMQKDPKGVLKHIASCGYNHVESFDGVQGMFWGMKHTDFKKYLTNIGLTIHASHCNLNADIEKKADEAAEIGMKYLIMPWEGPGKTITDYKKMAQDFNLKAGICKKAGINFAFHNHDYTFRLLEGQYAQDVLMQNTDPSLVDFEMDIYWVVVAGQDPEIWLKKYPNRFRLCHIKDRSKNPGKDEGRNSVDLGTGTIDFSRVLKTARDNGMQYFIAEQEAYPNGTPSEAVKTDAEFMKKLKF